MIALYNYVSAFNEGKLRPGFRVEGQLFVLTSTRPKTNYMALTGSCCSGHFTSHGKKYVTLASNQSAYRYNKVVGGHISLDVKRFEARFKVNLTHYITKQHNNMTKLSAFAVVHGFFILDNPELLGFEGDAAKVAMGLTNTESGLPMEQSIDEARKWLAAAATSEPAKKWGAKFQDAALSLARAELVAELTTLYGAESAAGYSELIDDASLPEMVTLTAAYLINPEDPAALELITKTFGDPAATPVEGVEINPQALQEAIAENQGPISEGVSAEELTGPEVLFEEPETEQGTLTIQPNLNLPAQPGTFQEGARQLLNMAADAIDKRLVDALGVKKVADTNFEDAVADAREFNQKAKSALEKMLEGPTRVSEPALVAENV